MRHRSEAEMKLDAVTNTFVSLENESNKTKEESKKQIIWLEECISKLQKDIQRDASKANIEVCRRIIWSQNCFWVPCKVPQFIQEKLQNTLSFFYLPKCLRDPPKREKKRMDWPHKCSQGVDQGHWANSENIGSFGVIRSKCDGIQSFSYYLNCCPQWSMSASVDF